MDKLIHLVAVAIGFIVFTVTENIIIGALAGVAAEIIILPVLLVRGQKKRSGVPATPEEAAAQAAARKKSLFNFFYYLLCGVYIACSAFAAYLGLGFDASPVLMIAGAAVIILGCVLLLVRKHFGILVSLAGSIIVLVGNFTSGIYYPYLDGHFDTRGFILSLLFIIVPGIILLTMILVSTKGKLFRSKQE